MIDPQDILNPPDEEISISTKDDAEKLGLDEQLQQDIQALPPRLLLPPTQPRHIPSADEYRGIKASYTPINKFSVPEPQPQDYTGNWIALIVILLVTLGILLIPLCGVNS